VKVSQSLTGRSKLNSVDKLFCHWHYLPGCFNVRPVSSPDQKARKTPPKAPTATLSDVAKVGGNGPMPRHALSARKAGFTA
jgi:hypothetical protein